MLHCESIYLSAEQGLEGTRRRFASLGLLASQNMLRELMIINAKPSKILFTDMTPLSRLLSLRRLSLNRLSSNLHPISSLTNLVKLRLGGRPVGDIGFLSSLIKLETLTLGIAVGVDLTPLSSLVSLKRLAVCFWSEDRKPWGPPIFKGLTCDEVRICDDAFLTLPHGVVVDANEAVSFGRHEVKYKRFRNVRNRDKYWERKAGCRSLFKFLNE